MDMTLFEIAQLVTMLIIVPGVGVIWRMSNRLVKLETQLDILVDDHMQKRRAINSRFRASDERSD